MEGGPEHERRLVMSERGDNIRQLETLCHRLLCDNPAGLSEHQLIELLREPPHALLPSLRLDDSLGLFQSHFLLFHALYRLRERLWREECGDLAISPQLIQLGRYRPGEATLCHSDPLREYYLDLSQLEQTGEAELEVLLNGFWNHVQAADERLQALAVLELDEAEDFVAVKQQYRRLVMRHHPDRGGEAQRMQALNDAFAVLQRYYSR